MCLCISMALGFLSLGVLQLNVHFKEEICTMTGVYNTFVCIFNLQIGNQIGNLYLLEAYTKTKHCLNRTN